MTACIYPWQREQCNALGITAADIMRASGCSYQAARRKRNGETLLGSAELVALARTRPVSIRRLVESMPHRTRRARILRELAALEASGEGRGVS